MQTDGVVNAEFDADLDEVEVQSRLPAMEEGEYLLRLCGFAHVNGDNGVFDIAQFDVVEARGEKANPQGSKGKISFKRDEKGMKKQIADKRMASFLVALNGGENPDSKSTFLQGIRKDPQGSVRVRVTTEIAEKSKNPFKKYSFFPA
jgi:hypothetical protein